MDLSRGMAAKDWKPHRLACAGDVLQQFVKDYFDQNPISQLGVIGIKGMTAEKLSDLSGNPKTHMERIAAALAVDKEPSLQNALEIARSSLKTVPAYGSREVVVVYGNLVTADPGDIFQTLASLKRENIRVSFIGIGAEMHLLRRIADGTDGTYHVAVDAEHMKRLMTAFTFPSPTVATAASRFATLVEMGFPQRRSGALSLCTCHQAFTTVGYLCPRCKSKSCDLPTTCQVCNLPLVSSPHLARSYHHLFPVPKFTQHLLRSGVTGEKGAKVSPSLVQKKCFGCMLPLGLDGDGAADDELDIEASEVQVHSEQQEGKAGTSSPPVEIAFSASAGVFVYQMGVAAYIQDNFDLSNCHFSGCSGRSWAATLLAWETSVREAWR
ncbi:unnamed protein product [Phytophthora lilii]|uniref:Unnamed protein product n=1 Tax=Phytophthora lilii TaxID=2077276 RepID=A0A9W6TDN3_9STRA|nr:unnamed protein product [Phytophthora lilii]